MHRHKHSMHGFTLVELMITLSIAAILLTQAVPSFTAMIANNRITSQINELVTAINMGRSEAAKRNTTVILCGSATPSAATPSCIGAGATGWLLFASGDANASYNSGADTLIRVGTFNQASIQVSASAGVSGDGLQINANGSTNEGGNIAIIAVCDDRDNNGTFDVAYGKEIRIQPSGHIQTVASPIATCTPA